MGIDNFKTDSEKSEERLPEDGYCPSCEAKGEFTKYWYIRCTNPDCEVITFVP